MAFLVSYALFKKKLCPCTFHKPPNILHSSAEGTVVIDPNQALPSSGFHFGSLQRQRTLSRKFSAKSRISSTLTEQFFQEDIVYDPEWEVRYDSLEFESLLGEGAFGRVLKGISDGLPGSRNATTVAIKMLKGTSSQVIDSLYTIILISIIQLFLKFCYDKVKGFSHFTNRNRNFG